MSSATQLKSVKLGFGVSGPLTADWFSERRTAALIDQALGLGVRHFDTAPFYGAGEARLAAALRRCARNDVIISTKTGTRRIGLRETVKDFSAEGVYADVMRSVERFAPAKVDIVYLHGPNHRELDAGVEVLRRLQADGAIARVGVCCHGYVLPRAVDRGVDAIMGRYNFLDRDNAAVFETAKAKGMHVCAFAPLGQALFAARATTVRSLADIWRVTRAYLDQGPAVKRAHAARDVLTELAPMTAASAALSFVAGAENVDAAMVTTTKPAHLAELAAAAETRLDDRARAVLDAAAAIMAAPDAD